jgi:hypothetical protein
MSIVPTLIEQSAPGVDFSDLPEGLSVNMADPVAGGWSGVRLSTGRTTIGCRLSAGLG